MHKVFSKLGKGFNQAIIKNELPEANVVYGFHTASLELFEYSKIKRMKCIFEQNIAPQEIQRKLLMEEQRQWQGQADNIEFPDDNVPL